MEITNSYRAQLAQAAIESHAVLTGDPDALENVEKARDLVGNIWHFLRLECGMTAEGATAQIEMALDMARQEYNEDKD